MKVALGLLFALTLMLAAAAAAQTAQPAQPVDPMTANPENVAAEGDSLAAPTGGTEEAVYPPTPERYERLVSYSKFVNVWRFAEFFISLAVLAIILFTGLSARFRDWTQKIPVKFFALWAFLGLFFLADFLLNLPFTIYREYIVENSYGFMNQTFTQWLGDSLLGLLVGAIFIIVPVWFLYWLLNRLKHWWLWFSLGAIPLAILTIVVAPVLISPLFNEFTPLKDKALETEILTLAQQNGIEGADVFEVDGSRQSTKVNAYVTGLFNTKRIVLYDTLIKNFTTDEIKFVMAHEMGHYLMNHLWWGLSVAIVFIMVSLWLASRLLPVTISRLKHSFRFDRLGDYASLPLIVAYLLVFDFFFQPVTNASSRYMERLADEHGMIASGVSAESAESAFNKLSVLNLSDPDPNPLVEFWFYTHPAIQKRIEFVRTWQR